MSDPVGNSTDLATDAVNITTKSSPAEVINVLELSASRSKKISFADNEKVVEVALIKGIERKLSNRNLIRQQSVLKM